MVKLDNLFIIIKAKGLTAKKVSADTGISTGNISDWKSGRSMPTATKLDLLADYLDCSVDYLIGRTDEPQVNKNIISNSNIIGASNNLSGSITINRNSLKDGETVTDELTSEMTRLFSKLTIQEKISLVQSLYEKENKR